MAQHYDVAARRSFEARAFQGDEDFDVNIACKALDLETLKQAEDQYDLLAAKRNMKRSSASMVAAPRTPLASEWRPADKSAKPCSFCGKDNHSVEDCWAKHGRPSSSAKRSNHGQDPHWAKKQKYS